MGERKSCILHQQRKEIELSWRKVNFLVVAPKKSPVKIDLQISDLQDDRLARGLKLLGPRESYASSKRFIVGMSSRPTSDF